MIDGNTALLHIGNFDTGKRTGLKRAVSEKELQSDNEKTIDRERVRVLYV